MHPTYRLLVCLAAVVCALGFALPASAQDDLAVSITNTSILESRINNKNGNDLDDDYSALINRFNLQGNSGDLSASLRLDTAYFLSPPEGANYRDDTRLERLSVQYILGDFTLAGGDFFMQLGRGIALSVRKIDETGLDVSIQGGRMDYNLDDFQAIVFAGRANPANRDSVSQQFLENTDDILTGAALNYSGIEELGFNLFGVYLQPDQRILEEFRDRTLTGGASLDIYGLADWLTVYLEGDLQQYEVAGGDPQMGTAAYGQFDISVEGFSMLFEGLLLETFEMRGGNNSVLSNRFFYNQPPTLERFDQEVLDFRDVRGGRVRLDYQFDEPQLLLYINGMFRQTGELPEADQEDNTIQQLHGFAGLEFYYQEGSSRLFLSGGLRDERQQGNLIKGMTHFEVDWVQSFGGGVVSHLTTRTELRQLDEREYIRGSSFAGLELTGYGALTYEFGYDTQDPSEDVRNYFHAGIASWNINDELQLRATVGTQRGGLKCVNGICRDYPSFAGASAELIGRF